MVICQFFREFLIFIKTGFSIEITINRDKKAYNSVPSLESIKLIKIIEAKKQGG